MARITLGVARQLRLGPVLPNGVMATLTGVVQLSNPSPTRSSAVPASHATMSALPARVASRSGSAIDIRRLPLWRYRAIASSLAQAVGGVALSPVGASSTRTTSELEFSPNEIIIISAMSETRAIGKGEGMPWNVPEEYQHFVASVHQQAVIMGRRSYEIFGADFEADTFVISRSAEIEGVTVCSSIEDHVSCPAAT